VLPPILIRPAKFNGFVILSNVSIDKVFYARNFCF
jgi:hypothetical protein